MDEEKLKELRRLCREAEAHLCDADYKDYVYQIGKFVLDEVTYSGFAVKLEEGYVVEV